jgi:replicative DNA helicase
MARSTDISPLSVLLSHVDAVSDGSPARDTVASRFPSLDKLLGGGFRRGDLTVLGGDVASGKSALALAIAIRASEGGARVAFLTGESTTERVLERVLAIEARTRIDDIRQGTWTDEARSAAGAVALRLRERLPIIERIRPGGHEALVAQIDGLPKLDLLIIDSIDAVLAGDPSTLDERTSATVRWLKSQALDRDIAILASAPLPRLSDRPDRRPVLDDFGGLGTITQLADVVLGLFRQDMYEPARDIQGATELLVRKNRNGPTGYVDLYFYAQWMRFEDMLDPDR